MKKLLCAAFAVATVVSSASVQADDEKYFNGAYIGASLGYLDVGEGFSGEVSYEGLIGYRNQSDSGFVSGLEGTFGNVDVTALDHIWSAAGLLGKVVGEDERGLVFLKAGYAQAKASAFGFSETEGGFRGDVGYEHALGKRFSVRVQASTYDFDSFGGSAGFVVRF